MSSKELKKYKTMQFLIVAKSRRFLKIFCGEEP
jgi:hypothetical protein